jgi:hypothetical protein
MLLLYCIAPCPDHGHLLIAALIARLLLIAALLVCMLIAALMMARLHADCGSDGSFAPGVLHRALSRSRAPARDGLL